jgi:hypothetical protein
MSRESHGIDSVQAVKVAQQDMVEESDFERASRIVQRLHRMLHGIERAQRNPNRREAYHIALAIEHVDAGQFAESEEAIRSAERVDPIPPAIAAETSLNVPPTVSQLRAALEQVARNKAV